MHKNRHVDDETFRRRLKQALEDPREEFALARVEFDRVDRVAEWFGDGVAEFVLDELALRLSQAATDAYAVTSGSGTTALVIIPVADGDPATLTAAGWRLMKDLTAAIDIGVTQMSIGATVGIAHPSVLIDRSVAGLINAATDASHRASSMGSRRIAVFEGTHGLLGRQGELARSLLPALTNGQIAPWFLPQVRLNDGAIVGAEALVRWSHPMFGLVSPAEFLPEAEQSGLVRDLDMLVLAQAGTSAAAWPAGIGLAVNLSSASLDNPFLVEEVAGTLQSAGLDPSRVTFDVAETCRADSRTEHMARLAALKGLGATLALQNWGAGYAYVDVLGEGFFDVLKIDRTLVRGWPGVPNDSILSALVEAARNMGLTVVAEGIETLDELERATAAGCNVGQGSQFHPPMPASEFAALLDPS